MNRPPAAMGAEEFRMETGVSRETLERLILYANLLRKWQRRINLVGRSTLDDLWRRHMLDSAQLLQLLPDDARCLVDLGSGAGFPGLVLAILGVPEVHLIEIDGRKVRLLKPETYMNLSGKSIQAVAHFYRIATQDVWVFFDDVDLKFGEVRFREKGSSGGHNGIKSIIQSIGNDAFPRVKLGIANDQLAKIPTERTTYIYVRIVGNKVIFINYILMFQICNKYSKY